MATAVDVARMKAANKGIVTLATRDLSAFWATLNLTKPEAARDALLRFLPTLTDAYGDVAASVAADWYDDLREAAGVRSGYSVALAENTPHAAVRQRTRFGATHLFTDTPDQTLAFLTSAVSKYVLAPGWDTIQENSIRDPAASGWHREVRAGACKFCRMLAGRGAVYKKATAHFAAHDNCNCVALPSWDKNAPEVSTDQYVASERTSKMKPARREQHRERIQSYLDSMPD